VRCHAEVVDAAQVIIAPDRHVNGIVDLESGCTSCHGGMGSNAPPSDTAGNVDVASPGVGAHQVHLSGGAHGRPVLCVECHVVPGQRSDPGHVDATPGAELSFSGVASAGFVAQPVWNQATLTCSGTYCHGAESPGWTRTEGRIECTACHGMPPPDPHPQLTACDGCHHNVTAAGAIIDRTRHVNGQVDY
jgi:predicted CxxxxCH...CXXCH cytochrome family protein